MLKGHLSRVIYHRVYLSDRLRVGLVRSHEKRRWLFEEPTQSQISTSILKYTTIYEDTRKWIIHRPEGRQYLKDIEGYL